MTPTLESPDRTVICIVLFADLVKHSTKSVAEQSRSKRLFNEIVEAANQYVPPDERILLDTGDGVAIGYLGDPEDALYAAMTMRRKFADFPDSALRIGLNLGPVKLVTDINGRPNMLGDGINTAERVMSFAEPGQILASRSFREVTVCMSAEYEQLFTHRRMRADKHQREHEVFTLSETDAAFARAGNQSTSRANNRRPEAGNRPRAIIAEDEPILREELKELLSAIWPELEIVAEGAGLWRQQQSEKTLQHAPSTRTPEPPELIGAFGKPGRQHGASGRRYPDRSRAAFVVD